MSKKTLFIKLFGVMAFLILFVTTASYADQYYDQYPGNGFLAEDESFSYYRSWIEPGIYHNDILDGHYTCPVNFSVPEGSVCFIKSMGIKFYDNLTDGCIDVSLKRKNLYTGSVHTVASWRSGISETSGGTINAFKGTESGVKLVDTKKFVYWLTVFFNRNGDVNPGPHLILFQIRIHYGT